MSRQTKIEEIERRIRDSIEYEEWVRKNKASQCCQCHTTKNLECHHIIDLYHIILGLWKFYGDWEPVFDHAIQMHKLNQCENATLCHQCHHSKHPGRTQPDSFPTDARMLVNWTTMPRNLWFPIKRAQNGSVDLLGLQTMFGIGWHVINGHMNSRLLSFGRYDLAKKIGKTPGTSFNKRLVIALDSLQFWNIIHFYTIDGNIIELYLTDKYLEGLSNPWFFPLKEVTTNNLTTLLLKWYLSFMSNRRYVKVNKFDLADRLAITTKTPAFLHQCLNKACDDISWAKLHIEDDMCHFKLAKQGATPIHYLRNVLANYIEEGR